MDTKTLMLNVHLEGVSAEDVYGALLDEKRHGEIIGADIEIEPVEGAEFSAWEDAIKGRNIQLDPGKKIVQEWFAVNSRWPEGHKSVLTWTFEEKDGGVTVHLKHESVPVEDEENVLHGWNEYYFEGMKQFFA